MKRLFYFALMMSPLIGFSQTELTLEEAIAIALENNYDIRLVSKDVAIAANNVNIGNAGMLPSVSGNVSAAAGIQNTAQTLLSGEQREVRGNNTSSTAYGASLDWTIFDGLQMFTRYEQLKALRALGEANMKATILTTVYDVMSSYFDLVQQKQLINATQIALELSAFRHQTAENRYQIGQASKLEVLAASVDLNTDTTNLLRQRDQYRSTQIRLNELLARDVNQDFSVADTFLIESGLDYERLSQQAKQLNPTLQSAIVNHRLSQLELKRVKGERYPVVNVSSAYTRSQSSTQLGFATHSRNNGFSYGIAASVPIFNGFIQRRNEKNAEFAMEAAEIEVERVGQQIESQLLAAYQTYLMNLELVRLEERNREIARDNLNITLEKFKLGSIAPLEFREAQRNFVDASVRFSAAQYQAKLAEMTLNQIAGTLKMD
ncbi:Outer membrane protein TolC [Parapedobacter composti]|uniref:Outer membrane protein TolC n=1 Tax=Parapedobacter composti TaxID=623281 RepID=A0A1I1EBE2_9SPHI|nr:TolC family protein [Parapedobacter composti]SFB84459.1 Outer membrane protein TolC [Parapedobacter composti]